MNQIEQNLLDHYYQTKSDIETLTKLLDFQKTEVLAFLKTQEGGKVDTEKASFTIRRNKTYKFSPAVEKSEKKLEEVKAYVTGLKTMEIEQGVAEVLDESETLVMTKAK